MVGGNTEILLGVGGLSVDQELEISSWTTTHINVQHGQVIVYFPLYGELDGFVKPIQMSEEPVSLVALDDGQHIIHVPPPKLGVGWYQ